MAKQLVIFKKGETEPSFTGDENNVAITGLAVGTAVAAGDYTLVIQDSENAENPSDPVDVPAFTVNKATEPTPSDVKVTPTDDGATVTVG